jgi:hypothetical protein
MSDDPDFEYLIVDSTTVRAHQHAAGAKKGGLKIRPLAARAASGARTRLRIAAPPIRNPHGGQFAGAVQLGQVDRILPIGLDTIAGLARDQRRST